MELLALLSRSDEIIDKVKDTLKGYAVYPLRSKGDLEDLLINIPVYLLIIDTLFFRTTEIEEIIQSFGRDSIILIAHENFNKERLSWVPDMVDINSITEELPGLVEKIIEKRRYQDKIRILSTDIPVDTTEGLLNEKTVANRRPLREHALINVAKSLTVSFDINKLFTYFMDSVTEIIHTNKMSIVLKEKDVLTIKAYRGLDPYIAENTKLTKDSGLIRWLARHGRILNKSFIARDKQWIDIPGEMEMLQCIFSFPMVYKGKLIGAFNIGDKITGEPFSNGELVLIYILCDYLAVAIKDIELHHQIRYQREFIKNILSSMNSGVITIGKDERISVFNKKASEILSMNPKEIIGNDLRRLPSPIGDILYETMTEGTSYKRHEIVIKPSNLSLGMNSYRLKDENKNPTGATIIFTDLSDLKRLEEEKRKAERLEAINAFTARIAHEIKNPLTAIKTFVELLDERYGDEEFKNFFNTTVRQSIHQLDNLTDKLVISSIPLDYRFEKIDLDKIIEDAINQAQKVIPQRVSLERNEEKIKRPVFISADRRLLTKALYYLLLLCTGKTRDNPVSISTNIAKDKIEISISFPGKALSDEEKQQLSMSLTNMDIFGIELNVSISKKIIEEHGGSIHIKSDSEGNVFKVTIPILMIGS